jgi:hypothetical protein
MISICHSRDSGNPVTFWCVGLRRDNVVQTALGPRVRGDDVVQTTLGPRVRGDDVNS